MPRKQKTIHYLYKTTCSITGKYYIGLHSTNNLEDGYMGSGKRLRYSIRKYGEKNHVKEILEFFNCREALVEAEKKIISEEILGDINCMNLMSGGTGGFVSVEACTKGGNSSILVLSDRLKSDSNLKETQIKNIIKANIRDYESRIKNGFGGATFKDKKHSEKTKSKISDKVKGLGAGEKNSQFGTMWITNGKENKKIRKDELIHNGWFKGRTR